MQLCRLRCVGVRGRRTVGALEERAALLVRGQRARGLAVLRTDLRSLDWGIPLVVIEFGRQIRIITEVVSH